MPPIAFPVERDGGGKAINGVLVSSLAARDAAVRRLNIAEREVVVRLAENGFGIPQSVDCLLGVALLKQDPALQHLHDCSHRLVAEFKGQFSALNREGARLIVFSLHAEAAALPEIGDGD